MLSAPSTNERSKTPQQRQTSGDTFNHDTIGGSSGLERLLRDAQAQVRDLLPAREESIRLGTELSLVKESLAAKDDELKKLQRQMLQERTERQQASRKSAEDHLAQVQRLEQRLREAEEKSADDASQLQSMQRESERKSRTVASLERELEIARQERQDERIKNIAKENHLSATEAERGRAAQQAEEFSRTIARLEQKQRSTEQQLSVARQESDTLRSEAETLRSSMLQLQGQLSQCECERDALRNKVDVLVEELKQASQLRQSLSAMEAMRSDTIALRDALEKGETTANTERLARRSTESERDQLLIKNRGLELEVKRLESDLHKAQCGAAERAPLRRENDELRLSLEHQEQRLRALQEELVVERGQRADEKRFSEVFRTVLSEALQSIRVAMVSRSEPTLAENESLQTSAGGIADASGLLFDGPSRSSRKPPMPSPIVRSDDQRTNLLSFLSNSNAVGSQNQTTVLRGEATSQVNTLLESIRSAVRDCNQIFTDETSRRSSLTSQLETEMRKNADLEVQIRKLQQEGTRLHIDLTAAAHREQQLTRDVRARAEGHNSFCRQLSSTVHSLQEVLGIDRLRLNESDESTDGDLTFDGTQIVSLVHHLVEHAAGIVKERDLVRRQNRELTLEIDRCHELHAATVQLHADQIRDSENRHRQQLQEMTKTTKAQLEQSTQQQVALSEAVQVAVERFETLSGEHQAVHTKLIEAVNEGSKLESALQVAKTEIERRRSEIGALQIEVQKLSVANSEKSDQLVVLQHNHSITEERHQALTITVAEREATLSKVLDALLLVGKFSMGLNATVHTLLTERSWLSQYVRMLESSLATLMAEIPSEENHVVAPAHSVRRSLQCKALVRYSTLRPVTIAVVAAQRILKLYFKRRAQQGPVNFVRVNGGSRSSRKVTLPNIVSLGNVRSLVMQHVQLLAAEHEDATATVSVLHAVMQVLESHVATDANKLNFDLIWRFATGLNTQRHVLGIGLFGQAKGAAIRLKQTLRVMTDSVGSQQRSLDGLKRENDSLLEVLQLKEQQCQQLAEELSRAQMEKMDMIEKRQFQQLQKSCDEAQAKLIEEKERNRTTEDRIALLQASEIQLMLKQSELQNEARSLAIELARKSAQLTVAEGYSNGLVASPSTVLANKVPPVYSRERKIALDDGSMVQENVHSLQSPSPRRVVAEDAPIQSTTGYRVVHQAPVQATLDYPFTTHPFTSRSAFVGPISTPPPLSVAQLQQPSYFSDPAASNILPRMAYESSAARQPQQIQRRSQVLDLINSIDQKISHALRRSDPPAPQL